MKQIRHFWEQQATYYVRGEQSEGQLFTKVERKKDRKKERTRAMTTKEMKNITVVGREEKTVSTN